MKAYYFDRNGQVSCTTDAESINAESIRRDKFSVMADILKRIGFGTVEEWKAKKQNRIEGKK